LNLLVTLNNKFEMGDWELVLRVGVVIVIVIEPIDMFPLSSCFVTFHSIIEFMHKNNLE
jgi:hypothetical protein